MDQRFEKKLSELFEEHGIEAFLVVVNDERGGMLVSGGEVLKVLETLAEAIAEYPAIAAIFQAALTKAKIRRKMAEESHAERIMRQVVMSFSLN